MVNRMNDAAEVARQFEASDPTPKMLTRSDFTLTNGTANEDSQIAEFKAEYPFRVRDGAKARMVFVTHDEFTHNGTGTAEATYSLNNTVLDSVNTAPVEVYKDTTLLAEGDSTPDDDEYYVDYSADEVTVDVDEDVTIHVFYVFRDPVLLEMWKEKPGTTGNVGEVLYDDVTADLHTRDQNQEPPEFNLNHSPVQGLVPKDWKLRIYADDTANNAAIAWSEATDDNSASNAVLHIPIEQGTRNISGLGRAVTMDIGNRR